MKINQLPSTKRAAKHRVGRGIAAGRGKTAGRGTKGQGARKSGGVRLGFEGGQMPLHMRIPKLRGFRSHRVGYQVINTDDIGSIKASTIDNQILFEAKLIDRLDRPVKLLAGQSLKTKKVVKLAAASQSAIKLLQAAGGSFQPTAGRQSNSSK